MLLFLVTVALNWTLAFLDPSTKSNQRKQLTQDLEAEIQQCSGQQGETETGHQPADVERAASGRPRFVDRRCGEI